MDDRLFASHTDAHMPGSETWPWTKREGKRRMATLQLKRTAAADLVVSGTRTAAVVAFVFPGAMLYAAQVAVLAVSGMRASGQSRCGAEVPVLVRTLWHCQSRASRRDSPWVWSCSSPIGTRAPRADPGIERMMWMGQGTAAGCVCRGGPTTCL